MYILWKTSVRGAFDLCCCAWAYYVKILWFLRGSVTESTRDNHVVRAFLPTAQDIFAAAVKFI